MKQLTDTELKDYAVSLLDKAGLEQYEQYILEHDAKLKQDCEYNGFYNVPAECEPFECCQCPFGDRGKKQQGCPYIEENKDV